LTWITRTDFSSKTKHKISDKTISTIICLYEEFEDTKGVIRNCISKKNTSWPKEKVQKDKQRSTKHTHNTKDRVTRTPLKTGDELRCSGRVSSSCSTSCTRLVNLVTNPVISHEWGKDREVLTTSGTYLWSFRYCLCVCKDQNED
jgi:hypothetical protein